MPNRVGHQRITTGIALAALPTAILLPLDVFAAFEAGILVTLIPAMTPDLDINTRKFGAYSNLIGLKAYSELVPHRYGMHKFHWSRLKVWNIFFLSHIPFLGTLVRSFLLVLPLAILLLFLQLFIGHYFILYFGAVWCGMSVSDCGHVIADRLSSDYKEMQREYWRGQTSYRIKSRGRSPKRVK